MSSEEGLSPWFAQLEMEDPLILQEFIGDCLVDYSPEDNYAALMDLEFHHSPSSASECYSSTTPPDVISNGSSNAKRQRLDGLAAFGNNNNNNRDTTEKSWTPAETVSPAGPVLALESSNRHREGAKPFRKPRRLPEQCHNHIIAERLRRQTLSERFIALSALIPGLKKMDKTSVLGEAINHMKQLKERLKILEEEIADRAVESVAVAKTFQVVVENESNSSSISNCNPDVGTEKTNADIVYHNKQLPDIEAKFSNRCVLLKIQCQRHKGFLAKLMSEIERLHLSVSSTHAMQFNPTTLDITIMAQMEVGFDMTPQDVVQILRTVFR